MTQNEKAAISCDLLLTGLAKIEMIGQEAQDVFGSKERAIQIISDWLEEYTDVDTRRDDVLRKQVLGLVLNYLRGQ